MLASSDNVELPKRRRFREGVSSMILHRHSGDSVIFCERGPDLKNCSLYGILYEGIALF